MFIFPRLYYTLQKLLLFEYLSYLLYFTETRFYLENKEYIYIKSLEIR